MKSIFTIFAIGFLTFFLIAQVNAGNAMKHTSEAMEHAGQALAHGEDGQAKILKEHAEQSLKHALEAENAHANSH
ncbi:MAG TPA: small metal-binding protein SmbP, partial [Nitrosomonas nitrosa]|nr:small metal-binding protein SmbP [Nitrosomonas nitrosa]